MPLPSTVAAPAPGRAYSPLGRIMFQHVRIAGRVLPGNLPKIQSQDLPSCMPGWFCLLILERPCSVSPAPLFVVSYFIYHQQGSIALRSGEFPGQRSLLTFAKFHTGVWCLEVCAGAPSSCISVPVYLRGKTNRLRDGPCSRARTCCGLSPAWELGEDPFPIEVVTLLRMLVHSRLAEKRLSPRRYQSMEVARSLCHHFHRGYFLSFVEYCTWIAPGVRSGRAR
jgi:hypothetical protein